VSAGLQARLRAPLARPADLGEVLAGAWSALSAADIARRPVFLSPGGTVPLGDLFEVTGSPAGRIRFEGDLSNAGRVGAGLAEGEVVVEGDVGREAGLGMSGGSIDVRGNAGLRAGAAAAEARRGMTGGELIVRGSVAEEAGSRMRRGLMAVGGNAGAQAGVGMIAGTVVVLGDPGPSAGLWSKRGSIVALGTVAIPSTYRYACTYRPIHLRLTLGRLRRRYELPIEEHHLSGLFRRYSGDLADLGKGEILAWTAE
jgi:formylmethanofuran dehydrogenase subunit C